MSEIITVILPWPSSALSPNSRQPWRKIEAVKAARAVAYAETCNYIGSFGVTILLGPLAVIMDFHPPTKRHFDLDNLISRCKAYQDGIFDALGLNDNLIVMLVARRRGAMKGGSVKISLERQEEEK